MYLRQDYAHVFIKRTWWCNVGTLVLRKGCSLWGKGGTESWHPSHWPMHRHLQSLLYKAGAKTSCTYLHTFHGSCFIIFASQFLKVWIPDFFCLVIRMAHVIANNRFFATYLADSRHIQISFDFLIVGCFLKQNTIFYKQFFNLVSHGRWLTRRFQNSHPYVPFRIDRRTWTNHFKRKMHIFVFH